MSEAMQEPPCIRTFETGKHEWNSISHRHFPNSRIGIPQCETCGWIDTEAIIKEVLEKFGGPNEPR